MYTTTLRMALPGPRRRDSEASGFAACICAQAGSFERSRGLGFRAGPLSVTLPLSLVPPGAARSVAGTRQRSVVAKKTRAACIERKPRVLENPEIMVLAEVEKRGRARCQKREGGFAVPTPCRFDFTGVATGGLWNGNPRFQLVSNCLN